MKRRSFLQSTASCSAHLAGLAAFAGHRQIFAKASPGKVVAETKFARLEQVAPGVFAMISTAFDTKDFTTVCNGGIIAGETGVLAIEGTMQPAGASWLAGQAKALTGRHPTDLIVTHFHGDHVNGHPGYIIEGTSPKTWITESTRKAAEENFANADPKIPSFKNVQPLATTGATEIDLGGRTVRILPKSGHTASDATIETSDPKVVWTGDLFFNRVFPNYGDATPPMLDTFATEMLGFGSDTIIIPGHGPVAGQPAVKLYQDFLAEIRSAATTAHKAGTPSERASTDYKLPDSLSDWIVWSPENIKKAFAAWYRTF